MKRLARWVGLAAFCVAFGFLGSIAAVQVMATDLRGEPGQPGPQGAPGEPGLTGPPGPTADLDVVEGAILELDDRLNSLEGRTDNLEELSHPEPPPEPLMPACPRRVEVVTSVMVNPIYPDALMVDTEWICASTWP